MLKVLVIAYYFPPMGLSGVQRTLKFVKYLRNYNWEPTVITTDDVGYFAHDHSLQKELEETNARVVRVGGKDPNSILSKFGTIKLPREFIRKVFNKVSQTLFIPDNKISWAKRAYQKAEELLNEESFDVVFVTGPPFSSLFIFSQLKKKHDIPLVIDYRDLWYESYFAFYPTPFHKSANKKLEYKTLQAADRVIVTNRKIKEKLLKDFQFLTHNDVVIISHGFDPEDFQKTETIPKHNDRLILTYSGIFMVYNSPEYLLRAFKELSIERPDITKNIELHFVGFLRKENKKLIKKLGLQEFIYDHGYVDHLEAVKKLKYSDVLWMMVGRRKNIDSILPGKLYEYAGAKKPILACMPDGAAKDAVTEYPASFICEPDNIQQIKEKIIEIFKLYRINELPTVDDDFLTKYRRDYLTEQLTKQFQFLIRASVI